VGPNLRTTCTTAVLKHRAHQNRPTRRCLLQDLPARFGVTILISLVAHPELNPIEMVWETVKTSLKRADITISVATHLSVTEVEFVKITVEVWAWYEDHVIKAETNCRAVDAMCAEVEAALADDRRDDEVEGSDLGRDSDGEGTEMSE